MRSLEASLRRLQTDYVDMYWVHVWDGFTPVQETLQALDDVVRAGKVLHVGYSGFPRGPWPGPTPSPRHGA